MTARSLTLNALAGLPLIKPGDDLGELLIEALRRSRIVPQDKDVIIVAQKVVSKAEGRYVDLKAVVPSARAIALAKEVNKDARLVETILAEVIGDRPAKTGRVDRCASARVHYGQRGHRPVQRCR